MPAVRNAKGGRQLAEQGELGRLKAVHDGSGIRYPAIFGRLAHEIINETAHARRPVRRWFRSIQLHADVGEQFAQLPVRNARRFRADCRIVPDPDLLDAAVGSVPRVALATVETVESFALRIQVPQHAVERAVLQHQNDDVLDLRQRIARKIIRTRFLTPHNARRSGPHRERITELLKLRPLCRGGGAATHTSTARARSAPGRASPSDA